MKIAKYVLYACAFVLVIVAGLLSYVKIALPNVGDAENLTIEYTPARIERGKYLANSVAVCMDCHSTRDWSKFSGPLTEGTLGKGGERFDQKMGLPGVYHSKNITPFGISRYTDGELFRVIATGVTKEGRAMFPLMPYLYYGRMDKEDIYAIIAYVRSLAPIENAVAESVSDFPMNFIINTIPAKPQHQTRPASSDVLASGAYLINAAGCAECHTKADKGQIIKELCFSGGREFAFPNGSTVRSTNITPDKTGIGSWTEEQFVQRFKAYSDSGYVAPVVPNGEFNSIMPWTMYSKMNKEDLAAIFQYLKTVKPIENTVERFTPRSKKS
jgi:hypothetical protein